MGWIIIYFFDTYSIIELIRGNKSYEKYEELEIITGILNLTELYWIFLNKYNRKTADYWAKKLSFNIVNFTKIECIEATRYRHSRKKDDLSFVDCLGYILSIKNNIKFLTGDKHFEGLDNVEFVR